MTITTKEAPSPRLSSNEAVFRDGEEIGCVGETGRGDWYAATATRVRYKFHNRQSAIDHLTNLEERR